MTALLRHLILRPLCRLSLWLGAAHLALRLADMDAEMRRGRG